MTTNTCKDCIYESRDGMSSPCIDCWRVGGVGKPSNYTTGVVEMSDPCNGCLYEGQSGMSAPCISCHEGRCEGELPSNYAATISGRIVANDAPDQVNSPNHYMTFPNQEAIDIIRLALTDEEFAGYCKGNFLKYRLRAGMKDNLQQEIDKSNVYRNWLFEPEDKE